jgi:ABC-type multidrug transport system ATPase subunit
MIESRGLSKRFGAGPLILDDVSVRVEPSETYCLLGLPGSGKTTIGEIFRSVVMPTAGTAMIGGVDCLADPVEVRRHTLFVTPRTSLVPDLSVRANVEFFCRVAGARRVATGGAVENALRRVGLPERVFDLQAQLLDRREAPLLVWLAVGWLRDVASVVLDDPSANLDARGLEWVADAVAEYRAAGKTLLITTSDVLFATTVGTRIGVLREGRQEAEYRPDEITRENLANFYVEYLGRPAAPGSARNGRV